MVILKYFLALIVGAAFAASAAAGPYPPAAGRSGSTAVYKDNAAFIAWAADWENYLPGEAVTSTWQTPQRALGKAEGTSSDIVSLGRGGQITLTFDSPIANGVGWDFAVFENSFSDTFLELAFVEVSSDGATFVRFDNDSLTPNPVGGFGSLDPTDIDGFAGKYRQAYGTPFDLADLATKDEVISGAVDLSAITHVRLVDVVGDGSAFDTAGHVIYDPYPTNQSAGFDLDAVGVRYESRANVPPDQPLPVSPADGVLNAALNPTLTGGAFSDADIPAGDFHYQTRWQISKNAAFTDLVLDVTSPTSLTTLVLSATLLQTGTPYFWRIQYYDSQYAASGWSRSFSFTTTAVSNDANGNGIPDDQELDPASTVDLNGDGIADVDQITDQYKVFNSVVGTGQMGVFVADPNVVIETVEAVDPDDYPDGNDKPDDTLLGLVSMRLRLQNPTDSVTITVYLSQPAPAGYEWFKHGPVKGWYIFPGAVFSPDRRSLDITLTDHGAGDTDGLANGLLVDPAGAGIIDDRSGSAEKPKNGSSGINGGSSMCFITTAATGVQTGLLPAVLSLVFICPVALRICARTGRHAK